MSSSHDDDDALIAGTDSYPPESMIWPMPAPGIHDRILIGTLASLRGRRRRWQIVRSLAMVLVFAGGVAAGRVAWTSDEPQDETPGVLAPIEAELPFEDDPMLLEMRAEHPLTVDAARLLRRAGDLFLSERMDIRGATRCYGRYLKLTPDDRSPGREDTWLLASLKRTF